MNKTGRNKDLQYKILIPGLNLDCLECKKRHMLTQYLINAVQTDTTCNLKESDKIDLINWLVKNKAFDNEIMTKIINNFIRPKLQNLKATYMSVSKTAKLKEQMDKYITLSMESWYINQNISGILKKCSEQSGINPHEIERGDEAIIPWRDPYYTLKTKDEWNCGGTESDILKLFYGGEADALLTNLPKRNTAKLGNVLDGSMKSTIDVIKIWIKDTEDIGNDKFNTKTKNFIKHCQLNYQEAKLFPITKFPDPIENKNKHVIETRCNSITNETNIDKRLEQINNWSKEKIDTIVGALMDPYFKVISSADEPYIDSIEEIRTKINENEGSVLDQLDEYLEQQIKKSIGQDTNDSDSSDAGSTGDSIMPISDFKMFYVLQNNNTQLKCFDQLKVLANFASFIKKVGSK